MEIFLFSLLLSLEEAKEELLSCSLNYWEQSTEVKVTFCAFEEASCSRLWLKTNSLQEKKMLYEFIFLDQQLKIKDGDSLESPTSDPSSA